MFIIISISFPIFYRNCSFFSTIFPFSVTFQKIRMYIRHSLKLHWFADLMNVTKEVTILLEAWHINSTHAPLNRDDGGLLPDAYLHLLKKKGR